MPCRLPKVIRWDHWRSTCKLWHSCKLVRLIENLKGGRIGYIGISYRAYYISLQSDNTSTGFNPIVELAKETGTPLHQWKESTLLIDGEGSLLAQSEANKILKQVWEILEEAIEYSKDSSEQIDPASSLYTFFQAWCDRALQSGRLTEGEAKIILGMSQMWGAYVGDGVELQSLKYFYLEDCIEGGRHRHHRLLFVSY